MLPLELLQEVFSYVSDGKTVLALHGNDCSLSKEILSEIKILQTNEENYGSPLVTKEVLSSLKSLTYLFYDNDEIPLFIHKGTTEYTSVFGFKDELQYSDVINIIPKGMRNLEIHSNDFDVMDLFHASLEQFKKLEAVKIWTGRGGQGDEDLEYEGDSLFLNCSSGENFLKVADLLKHKSLKKLRLLNHDLRDKAIEYLLDTTEINTICKPLPDDSCLNLTKIKNIEYPDHHHRDFNSIYPHIENVILRDNKQVTKFSRIFPNAKIEYRPDPIY